MKALVYHGPGERGWDTVEDPAIIDPTDAITTFADAANTNALKVVLEGAAGGSAQTASTSAAVPA
jgi:hypothetical protein